MNNYDITTVDITSTLNDIVNFMLQVFKYSFDYMRSIEFFGTNLFSFTITVFLLLVILPIIFTLVRSEAINSQRKYEYNVHKKEREAAYQKRKKGG